MKHYTDPQRVAITYAVQTCDTVPQALMQLYGKTYAKEQKQQQRIDTIEFRRDCERLGLGKIYKEKFPKNPFNRKQRKGTV